MTESSDITEERNMIRSYFSEIFRIMERIDDALIAVKRDGARSTGIVAGCLVLILWGMIGVPFIINSLFPISAGYSGLPEGYRFWTQTSIISVPILSVTAGAVAYFYAKKSAIKPFLLHKTKVQELEKAITENKATEMNIVEKTLQLMDQMSVWVPKLMYYKRDEAEAYGFISFFVVAILSFLSGTWSVGLPVSMLIGVIVWLYFRHEKRKEAELQIQEFKAWKHKFEEEKNSFLKTL